MTEHHSLTDVLMDHADDVQAGIDCLKAENARLKASNKTLAAALTLARGEMVEESGYTSRHPSVQAIDEALAYAKSEPQGLSKLNASEMAGGMS